MLSPTLSAILLASSLSVEAVSVYNYGSANCGTYQIGGCDNLPEGNCCRFTNRHQIFGNMYMTSATKSIKWVNLHQCQVGSWFRPGPGEQACGRERASQVGPSHPNDCLSTDGLGNYGDGAAWYQIIPTMNYVGGDGKPSRCPAPGIVQALPHPGLKVSMGNRNARSGIKNIPYPAAWGPISGAKSKRSIAGRTIHEVSADQPMDERAAPKCKGIQYADSYIWGEGDSVWILKGSKEVHDILNSYHEAPQPKQAYLDLFKSLGAKFYSDWRQSEELRENIQPQAEKHSAAEKRGKFPQIDATPAPPGAGDKGVAVKDTL